MRTLGLGLLFGCFAALAACHGTDEAASADDLALVQDTSLGERAEPGEAALVEKISQAAQSQLQTAQQQNGGIAKRDAHPKAHGCVTGKFSVYPGIDPKYQAGTFQPGKQYDAWIRYSNGSKQNDLENDARGMAIKLLNVSSDNRLLTTEEPGTSTHDLVLTNHHTFFIRNLTDYVAFMDAVVEKGNPLSFFFSISNMQFHPREALLAYQFISQPIGNPLTSSYYSATPYALGNKAVKYKAQPCDGGDLVGLHDTTDQNYLGAAMKAQLANGDACFEFMVQTQTNINDMPIEDPSVRWSEDDSPYIAIAKLTIPQQTFDSPEQMNFCENLSFTPWHATAPHRPLGSTNRARKVVYEATQTLRHRLNNMLRVEPRDLTVR